MSDLEVQPAAGATSGLTEWQRVTNTFTAPSKTFEDIKRGNKSWWLPFVIFTLVGYMLFATVAFKIGIAQVVEIAIRALSPAVNDTYTGVACVDWLADALLTLAERPPLEGNWYDTDSRLRVWMPPVRLERLAKLAFDQIRQASATTPAVLIHQLDAIRRLAPRLPDACRQALSDQADAILETASALVALDRRDLDAAWHRAHEALPRH